VASQHAHRRYVCTPPGGRIRDQHELDVFDGADRDGVPVGGSADGPALSRPMAAWLLRQWHRKALRDGASLWVTRYGGARPSLVEAEGHRPEVTWGPKYGPRDGSDLVAREDAR
jgi:hypothetical protein